MKYPKRSVLTVGALFICWLLIATTRRTLQSTRPVRTGPRSPWRPQHQNAHRDTAGEWARPIWSGSVAYLIMGEAEPEEKWVRRSTWPRTAVLYVSWRENLTLSVMENITSPEFYYFYLPHSTWTTGRNRQMELMKEVELDQGWRFEFAIYADEDVSLGVRRLGQFKTVILKENDDFAFRRLHELLMQDMPLIAGISREEPVKSHDDNVTCIQRCHADNMLVAIHRTAVDILPPYDSRLDHISWWASAFMRNVYMASVMPEFCNYYREIAADMTKQKHAAYPRIDSLSHLHAKQLAGSQLVRLGNIPRNVSACCRITKLIAIEEDSSLHPPCVAHDRNINFATAARKVAESFRRLTQLQSEAYGGYNRTLGCC
eukprot:scpid87137/ scgid11015/ 